MNGEYLSLETAEKLARIDRAIKFINKRKYFDCNAWCEVLTKKDIDKLLEILGGKDETIR